MKGGLPRVRRPAVFFDRDGVLNVDEGYTFRVEDLRFMPGAVEAVRLLNERGYWVFVVTNQSGIARGLYALDDVHRFHDAMQAGLQAAGAHIDQFYLSPYHPDGIVAEFAIDHPDRKPGPGMILKAMAEWPVDIGRSFLIGDRDSDLEAARRAGLPGYLYTGGDLSERVRTWLPPEIPKS